MVNLPLKRVPDGDAGTANKAGDINAHQIYTGSGKWNWIRINDATKVDLKYFSVREITPF